MPKYQVIGFYTYKGVLEIEAPNETTAMEWATHELPDIDELEISETFIQEAILLPDVSAN